MTYDCTDLSACALFQFSHPLDSNVHRSQPLFKTTGDFADLRVSKTLFCHNCAR